MYLDFAQTHDTVFDADVCVIGSGAAGFACAVTMLPSNLRVLVLEGGLKTFDAQAAALHRAEVVGLPHGGIHGARERIVGGTTTRWGGQALPFMAEDFKVRPHLRSSGWPLSLEDLLPYYEKAETILGTDRSVPFGYHPWKDWDIDEPAFSTDSIDLFVTKWCKEPNFARQHGAKVENSSTTTLLRNANAVELLPTGSLDAVEAIRIRSLGGKEGLVRARYIIAAGGALETVRLFLASRQFGAAGLGNQHGLVGSYFQDHVAAVVGRLLPASRKWLHELFDPFHRRGFKYFPRIRLSPSFAAEAETLHASAQVVFGEPDGGTLAAAKAIAAEFRRGRMPSLASLRSVLKPSPLYQVCRAAARWKLQGRGSMARRGPVWIEVHSEQEPIQTSCARLSDTPDALGMPRIQLDWEVSPLTIKTIRAMARLVAKELQMVGLGRVLLEPWISGPCDNPLRYISDVYHQAGGLRMASREEEGVVDSSCRVFGMANVYVASSAVFPTSSFSNPTMTTIALAVRVSELVAAHPENQLSGGYLRKLARVGSHGLRNPESPSGQLHDS